MQPIPRLLANLLVILVEILANLLVQLAKLRVRGAIGAPGPGNTLGRGSYDLLGLGRGSSTRDPWSGLRD